MSTEQTDSVIQSLIKKGYGVADILMMLTSCTDYEELVRKSKIMLGGKDEKGNIK